MMSESKVRPIFIFSLPRSGSTLLQRILASHSKISSAAEPWLLLPLLSMLKKEGMASIYSHQTCQMALEDLMGNMHGGRREFGKYLRQFVESVYQSAGDDGCIYFIDKTPRYYLVIPEIVELFSDAKFIFLFRNPIQVYASVLSTWGEETVKRIFHHKIDLIEGPALLSRGYLSIENRAYALQYEELVIDPEKHLRSLFRYLELDFEEKVLSSIAEKEAKGRTGDMTKTRLKNQIDASSLEKWKDIINNRFRKRLLKSYVRGLSEEALAVQGYNKQTIIDQVETVKTGLWPSPMDYIHYAQSLSAIYLRTYWLFSKKMSWAKGKHLD